GTSALQIADDDAVLMTLADGDLVDADHARRRTPGARELLLHVALIEVLDRAVMKALQVTDCLDGHRATECADVPREAPRVARVRRAPVKLLYEHVLAAGTPDAPAFELQPDPPPGEPQIADAYGTTIEATTAAEPAARALPSFFRRRSTT